jgi:O-antigen biosynthesis protein
MLGTDQNYGNPKLREELRAALEDASTVLRFAHKQFLIRHATYWYLRLRSRSGSDPIIRLINTLEMASRSLAFESLRQTDALILVNRIRQEIASFQRHRLYRYLVLLTKLQGPPATTSLSISLASIETIANQLQSFNTRNQNLPTDSRLLDIESAVWTTVRPLKGTRDAHQVTIVIPVYDGRIDTLACLHSVLTTRNEIAAHLVVIDDRSPDQQLSNELQRLASSQLFELIRHIENRGFVSSVNEGILRARGDVILLNSDTVVSDHWIDHLNAAASSREDLASVSPLSNNATILSYPYINIANAVPSDCSIQQLTAFLESRSSEDELIEIPTPVGFCMLMRRCAIERVGIFDEAAFGLGYGEESDWAMRARNQGYRHYVATRSFVYHAGGVSFADRAVQRQVDAAEILRRRHPNYWPLVADHVAADPISHVRRYLDTQRLVMAAAQSPIVFHVLHALGGGTEAYVRHISRLLKERGILSVFAQPDDLGRMRLSTNFTGPTPNLIFAGRWQDHEVLSLIRKLNFKVIHLHQILGFAPEILDLLQKIDLPLIATLHDYTYICPQVVLLDQRNQFCGVPSPRVCHQCIDGKRPILAVSNVSEWRERMLRLVSRAVRITAPSKAAADLFQRAWKNSVIEVLPHPEAPTQPLKPAKLPTEKKVVAVIGSILSHKGAYILEACVRDAEKRRLPLKFFVAGDFETDIHNAHLEVTGRFSPAQLPNLLNRAGASIGFLPSTWPETYSYVLSEYYRYGLYPVVFDIGAQSERVKAAEYGEILPLNIGASAINDALMSTKVQMVPREPPMALSEHDYVNILYGKLFCISDAESAVQ